MKNCLLKTLLGTILVAIMLCYHTINVEAAPITKTLDDDMRIALPGTIASQWGHGMPEFKKGTVVTLNDNGEVLEGTLISSERLPCVTGGAFYYRWSFANDSQIRPSRLLYFKAGTKVTFNEKGEVIRGMVVGDFIEVPVSQTNYIGILDGTEISFHENGMIATCTSSNDIYLRTVGWRQILNENNTSKIICPSLVQFKKGTPLELNDKCEVIKGTLNKGTKLLSPNGIRLYEAGTTVEFDDKGIVINFTK